PNRFASRQRTASSFQRFDHTTRPRKTAVTAVAMRSVRMLKRLDQRTQGATTRPAQQGIMTQCGTHTTFTEGLQSKRDQIGNPDGAGETLNCHPLASNSEMAAGGGLSYQKPMRPRTDATFA